MQGQTVRLQVPACQAGGLIGKGGAVINQLRQQSGCQIKVQTAQDMRPGVRERAVRREPLEESQDIRVSLRCLRCLR